jgi:antitoxin (DNA-binding transcriptional repressor) of toxin-antitoxin stability system
MVEDMKRSFLIITMLVVLLVITSVKAQPQEMIGSVAIRTQERLQERFPINIETGREGKNCTTDKDCLVGTICPQALGMDTPMCVEGKCICGPGRKACKTDEDCQNIVCPSIVGRDTPMCIVGICICGPGKTPRFPHELKPISVCIEAREKIREVMEKAKDEKNDTKRGELIEEIRKLREEYKDCFPQPTRTIQLVAIESRIKKAKAVDEFLEELKSLREEMLNNITSQNLTGKELAEVVKEYNEKRKELVKEFVQRIHEINIERIEDIKEVVVAKHVKWENETLFNVTKITVTVNGKNITIEPGDNVTISVEGVVVKSIVPLRVKNNTIEDAETNQTINETPEKVKARIREQVREMRLERKQGIPVYAVAAVKPGRLLGIVPISVNVNYEIAATNGTMLTVNRPWWSFLVFG